MTGLGIVLLAVFFAGMWLYFEYLKKCLLYDDDREIIELKGVIRNLQAQKSAEEEHLRDYRDEADEQFMLYELTNGISKSLTEAQAFDIFRKYLKDRTDVQNCRLVSARDDSEPAAAKDGRTQMFYIRGDDQQNYFLVVEGINPSDAEKVAVLGHQFALVYRRLQLYSQLEQTAVTDDLTRLLTRRAALDGLDQEIKRASSTQTNAAFVMIDVDHFKKFNDQYGHLAGDQILRHVADLLRSHIREVDMAGRYGGEEFCLILPNTGIDGARLTAERIRAAVEARSVKVFDAEYQVTISLGVSVFPDHARSVEQMIEYADQALYHAKHQGRNCVCVFEA